MYKFKKEYKGKTLGGKDIVIPEGSIVILDSGYFVYNGIPICSENSYIASEYIIKN